MWEDLSIKGVLSVCDVNNGGYNSVMHWNGGGGAGCYLENERGNNSIIFYVFQKYTKHFFLKYSRLYVVTLLI